MKAELTKYERERIVRLFRSAKDGEFWNIISTNIKGQIESERGYLNSFSISGISENDRDKYNMACGRLYALQQVLRVPEVVMREHTKFLDKLKTLAEVTKGKIFSFVGGGDSNGEEKA